MGRRHWYRGRGKNFPLRTALQPLNINILPLSPPTPLASSAASKVSVTQNVNIFYWRGPKIEKLMQGYQSCNPIEVKYLTTCFLFFFFVSLHFIERICFLNLLNHSFQCTVLCYSIKAICICIYCVQRNVKFSELNSNVKARV